MVVDLLSMNPLCLPIEWSVVPGPQAVGGGGESVDVRMREGEGVCGATRAARAVHVPLRARHAFDALPALVDRLVTAAVNFANLQTAILPVCLTYPHMLLLILAAYIIRTFRMKYRFGFVCLCVERFPRFRCL